MGYVPRFLELSTSCAEKVWGNLRLARQEWHRICKEMHAWPLLIGKNCVGKLLEGSYTAQQWLGKEELNSISCNVARAKNDMCCKSPSTLAKEETCKTTVLRCMLLEKLHSVTNRQKLLTWFTERGPNTRNSHGEKGRSGGGRGDLVPGGIYQRRTWWSTAVTVNSADALVSFDILHRSTTLLDTFFLYLDRRKHDSKKNNRVRVWRYGRWRVYLFF